MNDHELECRALYYKAMEDYRTKEKSKHEEAYFFLLEASKLGSAEADKLLGILYMSGQFSPFPEKNMTKAAECYRSAAENGDEEAMYWLSQCYEMGLGVEEDPEQAELWKNKAMEAGFEAAESEEDAQEVLSEIPEEEMIQYPEEEEAEEKIEEATAEEVSKEAMSADISEKTKVPEEVAEAEAATVPEIMKEEPAPAPEAKPEPKPEIKPEPKPAPMPVEEMLPPHVINQRFEETVRAHNQKRSREIPLKGAAIMGGCALITVWVLSGILFLILKPEAPEEVEMMRKVFWITLSIVSVLTAGIGLFFGWTRGKKEAGKLNAYEGSAFYKGFRGMEPAEKDRSAAYSIYTGLKHVFMPVRFMDPAGAEKAFRDVKSKHGLMLPGWCFKTRRGYARPEFVIFSPKAMYVVHAMDLHGRLSGDAREALWTLRWDNTDQKAPKEAPRTFSQTLPNLIEENEYALEIVKTELQLMDPMPLETVPCFNVLLFSQDLDIRGIRFAGTQKDVMVLHGGVDKLLTQIRTRESMLRPHGVPMEELLEVLLRLGDKQIERQRDRSDQTSFRAMNSEDFK